jgi:hypothetical protein
MSENPIDEAESEHQRRARRIVRSVTRKSVKYGYDYGFDRISITTFPDGPYHDPRSSLIEALAVVMGDAFAGEVVDALDVYLQTDPADRAPALHWSPPDHTSELRKAIKQRDEAVARAEKAEQKLNTEASKNKRARRPKPTETDRATTDTE